MKQVMIRGGGVEVLEVPAPVVEPGTVLVRAVRSCISAGTEMSGVRHSGLPLWKRAIRQPEKVRKVVEMAAKDGIVRTWRAVESRRAPYSPTGYSLSGVALEVGEGVDDIAPGDPVACAGAQCAHHAEFVCVPRNLAVPVPEGCDWGAASTVTLGAIALQGVRRGSPTLGETFVVLGLGILGQIAAQLLKANGCRVIGIDLDRGRIALASGLGMDAGVHPDDGADVERVAQLTGGVGADGVVITAATPSDAVVSAAFRMCRKKGRVVLVGDVGLNLNRADFYEKEIDFFISTSYGPGRYDRNYEERGLDYPTAYVRWTENRNMAGYLDLVSRGVVDLKPLVSEVFPVAEAPAAYARLGAGAGSPMIVLLSYPEGVSAAAPQRSVPAVRRSAPARGRVAVSVVGAGEFARSVHLPNLRSLGGAFSLRSVADISGHTAAVVAREFGGEFSHTDFSGVVGDAATDAVIITTRHDKHAQFALAALEAGKHVLVEKPLALTESEVAPIEAFYADGARNDAPVLLTGFNRRFSPHASRIAGITGRRSNPMIMNYRMNAGRLPPDHWVHGPQGGGRNLGEACHIYDLFTFFTGARAISVDARSIRPTTGYYGPRDNFVAVISFSDGSVGTLTYTALGSGAYPKEMLEIFVDGKVIVLDDYRSVTVVGERGKDIPARAQDKGHKAELAAFGDAIRNGGDWPIPLWQQIQATRIALEVERRIGAAAGPGGADGH